jgi:ABC-type uncharacterized transport system permease subunit
MRTFPTRLFAMNTVVLVAIALVFYAAAAQRVAAGLFRAEPPAPGLKSQLLVLGAVALAFHTAVLYEGMVTASGVNMGFFNALSLVAWVIVLLLLLSLPVKPLQNLGILAMPMAAVALVLSVTFPSEHYLPQGEGFGLELHIILAILAYSLLTIAAVQALVVAYQDHQLRHKRPGGLTRALPPLQTMENLLFQLIGLGFFLLSLAVVSGMMFLEDMFAQHVAHKTVLSMVAWVIFGTLLWGRRQFGWRGRVAIRWSLGGFVALMLAYFGSKLVLELILQR